MPQAKSSEMSQEHLFADKPGTLPDPRILQVDFTKMEIGQSATADREIVKCPNCGRPGEYRPSEKLTGRVVHLGRIVEYAQRTSFEIVSACRLDPHLEARLIETMKQRTRDRNGLAK